MQTRHIMQTRADLIALFSYVPSSQILWASDSPYAAPLTTFGIGGPARYFINAPSEAVALEALDFAKSQNLPLFVLLS